MDRNIKIDDLEIDLLIKEAVAKSISRRQQTLAFNSPIHNSSNLDNKTLVDFAAIRGGIGFRTMGIIRK